VRYGEKNMASGSPEPPRQCFEPLLLLVVLEIGNRRREEAGEDQG
jgi:hypothetical protein